VWGVQSGMQCVFVCAELPERFRAPLAAHTVIQ
jgi:hypothetical protein